MRFYPNSLVEVVTLILGFVIGLVVTFASWKGNSHGTSYKDDPRVKALLWGLAGLVVTLIGDWKSLLGEDAAKQFSRLALLIFYVEGYLAALVLTLMGFCVNIFVATYQGNKLLPPNQKVHPLQVMNDFLFKGYEYAQDKKHATEVTDLRRTITVTRDLDRKRQTALAALIVESDRYLRNPSDQAKEQLCNRILDNICTVAELYLRGGDDFACNSNYMLAIPYPHDHEGEYNIHFAWGDRSSYSHLLVLKHYARPGFSAPANLALPVIDVAQNHDWKESVLPGAPEAFLLGKALAVGGEPQFGRNVPASVQQDIRDYIATQNFNCFISLNIPILGADNKSVGIVNIESNHDKILNAPEATRAELVDVLNPFCALLGLLLCCEGTQ